MSRYLLLVVLLADAVLNGTLFAQLYNRAPNIVPGTLPEMREAAFWISKMKNPDEVVLSLMEIEDRNKAFQQSIRDTAHMDSVILGSIKDQLKERPGLLTEIPDITSMHPGEVTDLVQSMIRRQIHYLRSRQFGNIMAIEYSTGELDEIENEIVFRPAEGQIGTRSGIIINESRLRIIPPTRPEYIGLFTNGKARWDLWNLDVLPIGTPVEVLYSSRSGAFLLVLSDRGFGWVAAEKIALGLPDAISSFTSEKEYIICTGDKVPFYIDSTCTLLSGWLRMGDRLPLVRGNSKSVQIPVRDAEGDFVTAEAWLRTDADVHLGYLPYTKKHVAEQAFKLLDNLYDWTGAWYGRNHVTALRDVFGSFGFKLPGNGILLAACGQRSRVLSAKVDRQAQFKSILSNESFLTLQICENSHSQLYLGHYEGMPIVFDAHGYSYTDEDGNEMELKRWLVGTMEMPDYFLKQDITFVELY